MSGQVVAFPNPTASGAHEGLLAAVVELHALITIDPVLGASPARAYFVFSPEAKTRIEACLDPSSRGGSRAAAAYALVAYDFPFALHLFRMAGSRLSEERAREIVCHSAELQEGALQSAAGALGIDADPMGRFDAEALKAVFFPNTQESVTHVFRLGLRA